MSGFEKNGWLATILLVAANILCFLMETLQGGSEDSAVLLSMGASFSPLVLAGQVWRLFTCMFLHAGITHLMNNMLSLGAIGSFLEPRIGHLRFLILYLGGGIFGNVVSLGTDLLFQKQTLSVGASGGIFALFGALVCLALFKRHRIGRISPLQIGAAIFCLAAGTFGEANVDAAAHVGGFIGGFGLAFLLALFFDSTETHSIS